jgi:hypothetical protein
MLWIEPSVNTIILRVQLWDQLEAILESEEEVKLEILPNGEVRAKGQTSFLETGGRKPLTMREDLGGEY